MKAMYSDTSETANSLPPLILDIGVSLCSNDYATPLGKLTEETRYRYKWREYFRYVTLYISPFVP
jgi:hypothetical protein